MIKRSYPELIWVLCVVVATGIGWLLVRKGATPNGRAAVEQTLRQAALTDVESITVYPLLPGPGHQPPRPFQVREAAQLRPLLAALKQLKSITIDEKTFQPLLEATLVVRLHARLATAQQLHSRALVFRLASVPAGEVLQLAQTNDFYHSAALSQRIWRLRDSLARP